MDAVAIDPFASLLTIGDAARAERLGRSEDASLLARCRAGERAAFETLLMRYRERVINLAFQLLRHREDAEDVAQEVFVRAFSKIQQFRGEADLFTWLYRITLNTCIQRRRRARDTHSEVEPTSSPDSIAAQVETRLGVEHALDQLTPPLRIVLVLREMHDLSYEEIAAVLDIPVGTVRSRLSEARRKFREVWEAAQ